MYNILWFCCDQLRADALSGYGNQVIQTKNLDRLMCSGTSFMRAYCQNPLCTPSRASFLTGRYPRSTRAFFNGNKIFSRDEKTVIQELTDVGWHCGLTGKLHLTACRNRVEDPSEYGYEWSRWSHHPYGPKKGNAYQDWLKEIGIDWDTAYDATFHDWRPPKIPLDLDDINNGIAPEYHQTTWCVNEAISFIEQMNEQPWCVSVNVFDPHPPFDPPKCYKEKLNVDDMPLPLWKEGELNNKPFAQRDSWERTNANGLMPATKAIPDQKKREQTRDYLAQILLIDDQLGRLLDYLEAKKLREKTIVIFTSDHGEMLGDHGIYWKGGFMYEGAVHVPLIFSCPGLIQENVRSNALVELVDIAPTLMELEDLMVPKAMQGISLAPILIGKSDPHYHKDAVYCEYYFSAGGLVPVCATMYFDGRYKIIVHHNEAISELYDLKEDPCEYHNLWNKSEFTALQEELVIKCFNKAICCNLDYVLGNTGTF